MRLRVVSTVPPLHAATRSDAVPGCGVGGSTERILVFGISTHCPIGKDWISAGAWTAGGMGTGAGIGAGEGAGDGDGEGDGLGEGAGAAVPAGASQLFSTW